MGVSFKVAKTGTRYRSKPQQAEESGPTESQQRENEGDLVWVGDKVADHSNALAKPGLHLASEDPEVSFSLNLFPNGFFVGKANELFNNVPKQLHPYDRASEALFCVCDYRNILSQKGGTACKEKSPIIYKVALQMCMENVVKDILSISDDSWTYNDLLEVESRILKALRPDLDLNPKPMLDRFCEPPLQKKLNLGISQNRKRRKLSDASTTDPVFSIPFPGTTIFEVCATQKTPQSDLAFHDRGVPCSQQTIQSSIPTLQENNILQETILESFPLLSQSNNQLAINCNRSVSKSLTPSNFVSSPKPDYSNCYSDPRKANTSTPAEWGRCGALANRGPIMKKPKQEPLDFPQQQLQGSQAESILATELQWKNKLLNQKVEVDQLLLGRSHEKMHPSLLVSNTPKIQPGIPKCKVKEEPIETSSFSSLDGGKAKDNFHIICTGNNESNLQQSQLFRSSPLLKGNAPIPMQWNHMGQTVDKNIANEIVTRKKALQNSQVSTCVGNASGSSCLSDSLLREAPVTRKRKSNSRLKCSSMNGGESLGSTSSLNAANTISPIVRTPIRQSSGIGDPMLETPVPSHSGIGEPFLDRFSKMKMLTQRYGLNHRKRKFSQGFGKKQFFHTTPLVAFHLTNSGNNKNLKDANADTTSQSKCIWDTGINISRTRTLTFVHSSRVSQGNETPPGSEDQNKLIILEKLEEGKLEASAVYGYERIDPIELPLLQTFPGTHHADLFASQFTSLMAREGYRLAGDQIEPSYLCTDKSSTSQQPTVTTATSPAETVELPPPIMIPGQFPCMLSPMNGSMSGLHPGRLPPESNFSIGHLLPSGNIQSSLQLPAGYSSKPQLDVAKQFSPMKSQWQHVIDKDAFLQFQMLQRERRQQQLLQNRRMIGGLGSATSCMGTMQSVSGAQGLGNIGLGPFGNFAGMGGCMSMLAGGNMHRIGNSVEDNTQAAVLARMRMAEKQGRAPMSGVPIQKNPVVPMYHPEIPAMAYEVINQQPPPVQIQQQLYMLPLQQEIRSPLQSPEVTSLTEHLGSPTQVCHYQMDQMPQMSPRKLSSVLACQKMDGGNVAAEHESPELSSHAPGSVGGCNTSSSMDLCSVKEGGSAIQTGGIK
ncbi:hypothetical protein F0562_034107 [Nyssa sinensis]|uniref:Uncharacterized protein n=1 Tax=Nyssa sinensis TaxID=561372 RepID=A0A5J5AFQ3_9ASTE|nr:hypothetical protein F0562_034107 [Nyssa sinensis]